VWCIVPFEPGGLADSTCVGLSHEEKVFAYRPLKESILGSIAPISESRVQNFGESSDSPAILLVDLPKAFSI
jgi:hypothetical protein